MRERVQEDRAKEAKKEAETKDRSNNDLFRMEEEMEKQENRKPATQVQQSQPSKKNTKITYDEYQKLSFMICEAIRELADEGQDSVPQGDIVNRIAQKIVSEEGMAPSVEKLGEIAKKIQNCISHLINKENVLSIT